MKPTVSQLPADEENGYGDEMLNKKQLLRECTALANSPLSLLEMERIELAAIEEIRSGAGSVNRDQARLVLRMTSEIRKARGLWDSDEQAMTEREIDDELAMIRGQS